MNVVDWSIVRVRSSAIVKNRGVLEQNWDRGWLVPLGFGRGRSFRGHDELPLIGERLAL